MKEKIIAYEKIKRKTYLTGTLASIAMSFILMIPIINLFILDTWVKDNKEKNEEFWEGIWYETTIVKREFIIKK